MFYFFIFISALNSSCKQQNILNSNSTYDGINIIKSFNIINSSDSFYVKDDFNIKVKINQEFRLKGDFILDIRFSGIFSINDSIISKSDKPYKIVNYDSNNLENKKYYFRVDLLQNEEFNKSIPCKINLEKWKINDNSIAMYYEFKLLIDSILINQDTIYGYPNYPSDLNSKKFVAEKRWYNARDSANNNVIDFDFLFKTLGLSHSSFERKGTGNIITLLKKRE